MARIQCLVSTENNYFLSLSPLCIFYKRCGINDFQTKHAGLSDTAVRVSDGSMLTSRCHQSKECRYELAFVFL